MTLICLFSSLLNTKLNEGWNETSETFLIHTLAVKVNYSIMIHGQTFSKTTFIKVRIFLASLKLKHF